MLEQLKKLEAAATGGEWYRQWSDNPGMGEDHIELMARGQGGRVALFEEGMCDKPICADADLVVALRNAAPALLAVARLAQELSDEEFSDGPTVGRLREALAQLKEASDA